MQKKGKGAGSMLKYEIRKLAGHRFLAVLLCLLLAADAVFCLFGGEESGLSYYETDEAFYQAQKEKKTLKWSG